MLLKTIAVLSALLLLLSCGDTHTSARTGTVIEFSLTHSLRIPNYHVKVAIRAGEHNATVQVTTRPMERHAEQWAHTAIDKTFTIPLNDFHALLREAEAIDPDDIAASEVIGMDGNTCTLTFGEPGKLKSYSAWTPDYDTKERRLTAFLALCQRMIRTGGLQEKDVL